MKLRQTTHTHKLTHTHCAVCVLVLEQCLWSVLTELVLGPVDPALSRARATITLLFSPAQWTTIWLWESFRLACKIHTHTPVKQLQNNRHSRVLFLSLRI